MANTRTRGPQYTTVDEMQRALVDECRRRLKEITAPRGPSWREEDDALWSYDDLHRRAESDEQATAIIGRLRAAIAEALSFADSTADASSQAAKFVRDFAPQLRPLLTERFYLRADTKGPLANTYGLSLLAVAPSALPDDTEPASVTRTRIVANFGDGGWLKRGAAATPGELALIGILGGTRVAQESDRVKGTVASIIENEATAFRKKLERQ